MPINIDEVSKMLTLLERIKNMKGQGTLSSSLADDAIRKIQEALVKIFPPPPPP